jgi:hypothetical protein
MDRARHREPEPMEAQVTEPTAPRPDYILRESRRCRGCRQPIHWWETPAGNVWGYDEDGTDHVLTCPARAAARRIEPTVSRP